MKILVVNGPNLNMLGIREPNIYGRVTLKELEEKLIEEGKKNNQEITCFQSNHEGEIIDVIQNAYSIYDYIVINPAAFTHYSIGIRDALKSVSIPFIEVHLSNIHSREDFRKVSYFSDIAIGTISGFGISGYLMALSFLKENNWR